MKPLFLVSRAGLWLLLLTHFNLGSNAWASTNSPVIISQPQSAINFIGTLATFSATATGSGPLSYQWHFTGQPINDATDSTYKLPDVTLSNAGDYQVTVGNTYGSVTSVIATLTVLAPATIGPYGPDPYTLHLWHFNEIQTPAADDVTSSPLALNSLANGATLGNNSAPGFGLALSTFDGGPDGVASTDLDASLSPQPLPDEPTVFSYADPATGAFTYEAIVRIDFDPSRNYGPLPDGNGRNQPMEIISADSPTTAARLFQFRLDPIGFNPKAGGFTNPLIQPMLEFINMNQEVAIQTMFALIPTNGPDGIISNQWFHVAVSYDGNAGTAGNFKFFWTLLNPTRPQASLVGSAIMQVSLPTSLTPNFVIGNQGRPPLGDTNAPVQANFLGLIDEVRISRVARSAIDMQFKPSIAPQITVQPISRTVASGSNVTFTVTAGGSIPLNYQWQFNGVNRSGATNSSFTVSNANLARAGNYRVIVSNSFGSVTSLVATLTVVTPPSIIQQPDNAQVTAGGPIAFRVIASSSGTLTYQWFLDDVPISGATNAIYSLSHAQFSDEGEYSVQLANLAGSATSAEAELVVLPATTPSPKLSSYSIELQPGLNLIANQLDVGGNNLNEVLPVVPDGTVASKYDNLSGTWLQSTYNAALGAWGPSSFTLSPGEGAFLQVTSNYDLTFTGKPRVPVLPVSIPSGVAWLVSRQTDELGTYESIVGAPPSDGAFVYKWDNSNATYITFSYTSNGWSGGVAPTVAVGEAVWIAPNGAGPVALPAAPAITQQPASLTVALGRSATFSVTATGTQPLLYQWRLNGNAIAGATSNVFALVNVQPGNAGSYSVSVNNSVGLTTSASASLAISNLTVLPFADIFTNAGSIGSATNGAGIGTNIGATLTPGEPTPLGLVSGASVWLRWEPQLDGLATFATTGSGFDTLLGVYTGSTISNLVTVAADDDSGPSLCSIANFNALAGITYFIQVSGFEGATGTIGLQWSLNPTTNPVPVILTQPLTQTVLSGSNVTLSVTVQPGPDVSYQWFSNYVVLPGETNSTLLLAPARAGLYFVAVTNVQTLAGVLSLPADIEVIIADAGQRGSPTDVHGQDKFAVAADLTAPDPNIAHDPPPAGSYTGTQDFTTAGTTTDPTEPAHCGFPPCATKWFSYQAPASGLLTVDTVGANFNAVLAIYTGPGDSYATLVPVACSGNHGSAGEKVSFAATSGTIFWVVVGGVNCATGSGTIHYNLTATPAFTLLPVSQTVTNGSRVTLNAGAVGALPLGYQWRLNGSNISGATSSSLVLASFQSTNQGNYSIFVNNVYGSSESPAASLYLNSPPRLIGPVVGGDQISFQFVGIANTNYVIERSTNLTTWVPIKTNKSSIGIFTFSDSFTPGQNRFYRGRKR